MGPVQSQGLCKQSEEVGGSKREEASQKKEAIGTTPKSRETQDLDCPLGDDSPLGMQCRGQLKLANKTRSGLLASVTMTDQMDFV